jgi:hypothetical protein
MDRPSRDARGAPPKRSSTCSPTAASGSARWMTGSDNSLTQPWPCAQTPRWTKTKAPCLQGSRKKRWTVCQRQRLPRSSRQSARTRGHGPRSGASCKSSPKEENGHAAGLYGRIQGGKPSDALVSKPPMNPHAPPSATASDRTGDARQPAPKSSTFGEGLHGLLQEPSKDAASIATPPS